MRQYHLREDNQGWIRYVGHSHPDGNRCHEHPKVDLFEYGKTKQSLLQNIRPSVLQRVLSRLV